MDPMEVVFIDMILDDTKDQDHETDFSNKTSSSYIRGYLDHKTGDKAEELYDRFIGLCEKLSIPEDVRLNWFSKIRDSYSTHWRYRLNLYHLYHSLQDLDKYYDESEYGESYKMLLEVAIWFHRITFVPLDIELSYNVRESYKLAEEFLKHSDSELITSDKLSFIKSLILSSHRHKQVLQFEDPVEDS